MAPEFAAVAFIRYLDLEVSLIVVAAVLTVLGYSLNDTIVIFDRVRENQSSRRGFDLRAVLDMPISETLPRTLLTGDAAILRGCRAWLRPARPGARAAPPLPRRAAVAR